MMVKRRLKIGALILIVAAVAFSFGYVVPRLHGGVTIENSENPIGGTTGASEGWESPETPVVAVPDTFQFFLATLAFALLGIVGGMGIGYLIARCRVSAGMAQPPSKKLPKPTVREQVIAFIKGRREFTIPELVRATDGTEAQVWRVVRKLISKGVVRPTDRTRAVEVGPKKKEEASRVFEYVGGAE